MSPLHLLRRAAAQWIVGGVKIVALLLLAVCVAACGGTAAAQAHSARPVATRPSPAPGGAAACATLSASALPSAAYDQMVTRQTGLIAHGGDASAADISAARARVAAWIHASCPQFAYLLKR
jgi:hypothetical protein